MQGTFGKALHHFLILAVSFSCLSAGIPGPSRPADPLCGMDPYPFANSILDRQLNRLDNDLLVFQNKNNGTLFAGGGLPGCAVTDTPVRSRCSPKRFFPRNTLPFGTCLWYVPLLSLPPPQV